MFAITRKPVWLGHFQIVLDEPNSAGSSLASFAMNNSSIPGIGSIIGANRSQLNTEVKVLESPSVLKPTFDFVKARKAQAGENVSNLKFQNWRGNLNIELEKGTSVLNITYTDTDRNIILPVLKSISKDYQRYSGKDRSNSISKGLAFTKKLISEFRQKAEVSSRELDSFSIRYGIPTGGTSVANNGTNIIGFLSSNDNASAVNSQGDALGQLAAINQELIRRKQRFTENDPSILALIRERDALRHYYEITGGGNLTLTGNEPMTKGRSQEIILEYKKLKRKAKRDVAVLNNLESSLLSLQLEEARQTEPWELISTPTLLDNPVAPQKKRIVALGLMGGLVLGCAAALIIDRRSGIVFSEDELRMSLPGPLLERLQIQEPSNWYMALELLANGPLNKAKSVALIPVGQHDKQNLRALEKDFQLALGQRSLIMSSNLVKTRSCDSQVLLVQPGNCRRTQLSQLQQRLTLQGTTVAGWLLLDPTDKEI